MGAKIATLIVGRGLRISAAPEELPTFATARWPISKAQTKDNIGQL